ncbi:alpha/beta hydrolase [Pseudodonghicola xiamenensis]|uniref:Alpha/beta hydrolase n=1 Tax=Pseudodonghicola xiamenensis TaxID=337702 RepID=A0A8J3H8X0_9RHOB|nr:alpha/beta hydrolase [Pseudodonghicola xiamenensis]GHG92518.1 hypothetical protein GCM10010961_24600 [Pseudodonghicola xiamenensis]
MKAIVLIRAALVLLLVPALASAPRAEDAEQPVAAGGQALAADPGFARLRYSIANDPDWALDRVAALLAALQKDDTADARVIFDLYTLAANLMIEGGSVAQAAQVLAQLADFSAALRDEVGRDPIPLYAQAAALLEDTGQLQAARETLVTLLAEQRAGGLAAKDVAPTRAALSRVDQALGGVRGDVPVPPQGGVPELTRLFYATDRAQSDASLPQTFYGKERGDAALGVAGVLVPEPVALGYAVLRQVEPLAAAVFYDRLEQALAARPEAEILVYVHGAGMTFEEAARRAAGLARALHFDGVPVLYSWASGGSVVDYVGDSAAVELSGPRLGRFLDGLLQHAGGRRIHLVARGLGARPALQALTLLAAAEPGQKDLLGQVVFVAPDVDAGAFLERVPLIRPLVQRLTLYTSDRERTLDVARGLYGDALRAGDGGGVSLVDAAMDSLDVSGWGRDPLRPVTGAPALTDLAALIRRDAPPSARCGLTASPGGAGDGLVWEVSEEMIGVCGDPAWPALLAALPAPGGSASWQQVLRDHLSDPDRRSRLEPALRHLIGD